MYKRIDLLVLFLCLGLTFFAWHYGSRVDMSGKEIWNIVLGVGFLFSFVVYALVFSVSLLGTKSQQLAESMTHELLKYKKAIDSSNSHMIITDTDGKVLYANQAVTKITGFENAEVLGANPSLWGGQMDPEFYKQMWKTIKEEKKVFEGEVTKKRKNGEIYIAMATISPILDGGDLIGFVGSELDITERKKFEEDLKRANDLMVGRELKMIELKKEIAKLKGSHNE